MDWNNYMTSVVVAACVAGVVSVLVALFSNWTIKRINSEKLAADRETFSARIQADLYLAVQKLSADQEKAMSDKAWADYALRRDRYFEIAELIDCLFVGGDASNKSKFHKVARTVRLVGSDEVVRSLNDFTDAIKQSQPHSVTEQKYRAFFNAMRLDIRELHTLPPQGTALGPDAFPLEG